MHVGVYICGHSAAINNFLPNSLQKNMKIETYQLETHESYSEEEIKIVYEVITGFTFFIIQIG